MKLKRPRNSLSSQHQIRIEIKSFFDNEDFNETLTRTKFEELNVDLFQAIRVSLEYVFEVSKSSQSSIDEIILTGGSTRIPKIQELIKDFLHQEQFSTNANSGDAAGIHFILSSYKKRI